MQWRSFRKKPGENTGWKNIAPDIAFGCTNGQVHGPFLFTPRFSEGYATNTFLAPSPRSGCQHEAWGVSPRIEVAKCIQPAKRAKAFNGTNHAFIFRY